MEEDQETDSKGGQEEFKEDVLVYLSLRIRFAAGKVQNFNMSN